MRTIVNSSMSVGGLIDQGKPKGQDRYKQRLALALAAGRAGTFDWDLKRGSAEWSKELLALYGIAPGEFGGRYEDWLQYVVPEDRERAEAAVRQSLETGTLDTDFRIRRSDNGELRWMNSRGTISYDESGKASAMLGINFDVTELKLSQQVSAQTVQSFLNALDTESVGVLFLDRTGRVVDANTPFLHMTGYSKEEVNSGQLTWRRMTPPEWVEISEQQMRKMATTGLIGPYEKELILKDGRRRWMRLTGRDIGHGTIAEYCFDIHEQKQAEQALRIQEERFRFIGDRAQVGYWDWDLRKDTLEWSPVCKKLFGIPEDVPITYPRFMESLLPDDRERTEQAVQACLQSGGTKEYDIEYRAVWPDKSVHWIRAKGAATFQDGAPLRMAGIAIDISDSKHTARALEESLERLGETEAQFRALAESVPQLVWTCNADGDCDYLSTQWVDYTGVEAAEQLGHGWLSRLHNDDRQMTMQRWQEAVQSGQVFDVEFRLQGRHGRYRWFKTRALAHRDASGIITKWFGTCTDIEDQKRIETELRHANGDLQQFVYSASHDLRQPLRSMITYGQLLQRRTASQLDGEAKRLLDVIIKNGQRMNQLLSGLLQYSSAATGSQDENAATVDAAAVLQNVIAGLQPAMAEVGAQISNGNLPSVRMSEVHLQQLLQNLLGNALKYRREGVPPQIQVSAVKAGLEWRFAVADNGIGIDAEDRNHVFGLFKRLHGRDGRYEGTGLGLAICQRIVERYGGRIWLESEVGAGTVFYFTIACGA